MNLEEYAELTGELEVKLDEADKEVNSTYLQYTHDEIFSRVKVKVEQIGKGEPDLVKIFWHREGGGIK